ncbi:hypothetical protein GTP90_01110 [Rugamonas sp. FT81W]|uniref:Uncharacterized protein n=2 Tax=Duganella vulcania TaxID=2692166 RepID=A0A845GGE0_9BURK|nr:hypothetical protein [Duganella vulcania]
MNMEQAMAIYQRAVDPTATAQEGADWWREVFVELTAVVAAPSIRAAAGVIAWWKSDYEWLQVNDTPAGAAGRIRRVAKVVLKRSTRPSAQPCIA